MRTRCGASMTIAFMVHCLRASCPLVFPPVPRDRVVSSRGNCPLTHQPRQSSAHRAMEFRKPSSHATCHPRPRLVLHAATRSACPPKRRSDYWSDALIVIEDGRIVSVEDRPTSRLPRCPPMSPVDALSGRAALRRLHRRACPLSANADDRRLWRRTARLAGEIHLRRRAGFSR